MPRGSSWTAKSAAIGEGVADRLGRRRDDDERARCPVARRGGLEDVGEHGPAADRVEDLGEARAHARAEAGGEDDRA